MKVGKSVAIWEVIFEKLFIDDENNLENYCLSDSKMKTFKNSCLSRPTDPCKVLLYLPSPSITALHSRKKWGMMVQDILQQWSTIISIMRQFGNN